MKRIKKAVLIPIRRMACRSSLLQIYYWADSKLNELSAVCVMPRLYYRALYSTCMWLVEFGKFQRFADRAIHTIPYNVRFEVA